MTLHIWLVDEEFKSAFSAISFLSISMEIIQQTTSKQIQMLFFDNYSEANEELWVELIPYDK